MVKKIRLKNDCVEAYVLYAKVLKESGKLQEADDLYKKGLKTNPENANLMVYRALLYLQQTGGVNTAIESMNKAVKVDDKCEFAFETLGQIEIQRGNLETTVTSLFLPSPTYSRFSLISFPRVESFH